MKGNMVKKQEKRGTPADAQSPEARAAANKKNNQQQYHLSHGHKQAPRSTELSEFDGKSPSERAASRGVKNPPTKRVPTNPWN
jgi:hypothetical protein